MNFEVAPRSLAQLDAAAAATLASRAPLASPNFTGTPTVPTANAGTSSTQAASTAFVAAAIAALINGAPGALDQLNELAEAIGANPNFAADVTATLALKLSKASNLADLTSIPDARANLGLGAVALLAAIAIGDVTGLQAALDAKLSFAQLLTMDGEGSGLDADLLDGAGWPAIALPRAWQDNVYYTCPANAYTNFADSPITFHPFFVPPGTTPNRLAINNNATGVAAKAAIYTLSATTGLPETLLHDTGSISIASTTGFKEVTIAWTHGWGWFAGAAQHSGGNLIGFNSSTFMPGWVGDGFSRLTKAQTFATAFPATLVAGDFARSTSTVAAVYMRRAV